METKDFPFRVVLTGVSGILVSPMGPLYGLFSFVAGRSLMTHELVGYFDLVSGELLRQFPQLSGFEPFEGPKTEEGVYAWADRVRSKASLPDVLSVAPFPKGSDLSEGDKKSDALLEGKEVIYFLPPQ